MLISFEGIDGCGKTTQIGILEAKLIDSGYKVLRLREPGGAPLSEQIREILLNSKDDIHPITELMLFESARSHLYRTLIAPALAEKTIVICDRFTDSTIAYQGYGRGLDIDTIRRFNKIATDGVKPDITFYLDVELETARARSSKRISDRIESAGEEFFLRIIRGFRELAAVEPERIIQIDARNEIEDSAAIVWEKIQERMGME
jgi:dTMP kinase